MGKRLVKNQEKTTSPKSTEDSAAPALSRGLALLKLLNQKGSLSLEEATAEARWPKSSVARLLDVLEKEGLLFRDPQTRRYTAIYELARKESIENLLRQLAPASLQTLANQTHQTAELHLVDCDESGSPGLIILDQFEPADAVVHVRARIGNRRDLTELDATTQVLQAFKDVPLSTRGRWVWRQGKKTKMTAQEQQHLIHQARKNNLGLDVGINTHGVYRYAVPICDAHQHLRAVLVLAQLCTPHGPVPPREDWAHALQKEGSQLQDRLNKAL